MLEDAGATTTQAAVYVVDPTTGQPTEVPLTPRRPDGQVEYGPQRGNLLAQNVNRVGALLQNQAASGPFDLLGMIASAVRVTSPPVPSSSFPPACPPRAASISGRWAGMPTPVRSPRN